MTSAAARHDLRPAPPASPDAALLVVASGLVVTLVFGALSTGYHHADDLSHYLFARWAWTWPEYLVHDWGRPGFTLLYFLPSYLGWWAARAWSAVLSALTAWMTFRMAQRLGLRRAWLAPLFLYLQPRFFTLAETTLTETALAFYLATATWLMGRKRWSLAAAVLSLAVVTRHEAIVFVPVFIAAAWWSRQRLILVWPVVLAPLLTNLVAWAVGLTTTVSRYFDGTGSGYYGHGGWYEFFSRSLEAFGPAIAALGFVGAVPALRQPGGRWIVTAAMAYFATHVLIRMFGKFDSGGYGRFLVGVSPFWAVMAACAWERLTHRDARPRVQTAVSVAVVMTFLWGAMELQLSRASIPAEVPRLWQAQVAVRIATAAVVLTALAVWLAAQRGPRSAPPATVALRMVLIGMMGLASYALCGALRPGASEERINEQIGWLHQNGYAGRTVLSAHVWVHYRTGFARSPRYAGLRRTINEAPAGTIIFWEDQFAAHNEHPPVLLDDLTARNTTFRLLRISEPRGKNAPEFYLFEKITDGPMPEARS